MFAASMMSNDRRNALSCRPGATLSSRATVSVQPGQFRSEPSVWTHPLCLSPCVQVVTDSLARHFDSKKFLRNELRRSQCADVALRDGTRVEGPRWPKRDHRGYGWPRPPFRHLIISGGVSTIGLKSYDRGREAFQGANLDWGWADEEAPLDV